jgi:hypothetical protein
MRPAWGNKTTQNSAWIKSREETTRATVSKDNTKIEHREIGYEDENWAVLTQDNVYSASEQKLSFLRNPHFIFGGLN